MGGPAQPVPPLPKFQLCIRGGEVMKRQKGAAAVEFALVLPLLAMLVLGMMEFGYFLFLAGSAAGAAREGAREMAIHRVQSDAEDVARSAFISATRKTPSSVEAPASCAPGERAVVTVSLSYSSLTGMLGFLEGALPPVHGEGVMRCGG